MSNKTSIQVSTIISLAIFLGVVSFLSSKNFFQWEIKEESNQSLNQVEQIWVINSQSQKKTIKKKTLNIDSKLVETFLSGANNWFLKNFKDKWVFTYGYNAYTGRYSTKGYTRIDKII